MFGSSYESRPIEDRQLALIGEVFDHPEPATTEHVVMVSDIEKGVAKEPLRWPLYEHLEVVEESIEPADKTCSHCNSRSASEEEVSERLDPIPPRLIPLRTVRPV